MDIRLNVENLGLNLSMPSIKNGSNGIKNEHLCPIDVKGAHIQFRRRGISSNSLYETSK